MTHVFVVNSTTFHIHLRYLFAGTGTVNLPVFLNNSNSSLHYLTENNLVSIIADISRIQINDKILFYVQGHNGYSGTFFGIFRAVSLPFYCRDDYLKSELIKSLQYRILIKPDKVYQRGISEYTALDCLKDISHPSQMCWSLIYRKLRGNRGCTMITEYESERLINLIMIENNYQYLTNDTNMSLAYNIDNNITITNPELYKYTGNTSNSLLIDDRLLYKINKSQSFESHLQAYIIQHIMDYPLKKLLIPNDKKNFWLGNEVGCGVGMQKIDMLVMQQSDNQLFINIIELKCKNPSIDILKQLNKYIQWVIEYICPLYTNITIKITPIIIVPYNINNIIDSQDIFEPVKKSL